MAVPIPFSDAGVLVPIQVGMLAGISPVFGHPISQSRLATLVSSTLGGTSATVAGRSLVAQLLKLVPGAGSLAGGLIAGTTATGLAAALGEAYITTLVRLAERDEFDRVSPPIQP